MNMHIVAPIQSSARFHDPDCATAARRRRRNLLIILGLSALSWLLIGALIAALA
jgi:hypothetical protein